MSWLKELNPFYWKKRALQAEQDYQLSCDGFNIVQDEVVLLKNKLATLSVQYDTPVADKLATAIAVGVHPDFLDRVELAPAHYTDRERKMFLDLEVMRQQLEFYEDLFAKINELHGDTLSDKWSSVTDELYQLRETLIEAENREDILVSQQDKLKDQLTLVKADLNERTAALKKLVEELEETKNNLLQTQTELKHSMKLNRKWLETVVGLGVNEGILLTKSFWGKESALVEFGDDKTD